MYSLHWSIYGTLKLQVGNPYLCSSLLAYCDCDLDIISLVILLYMPLDTGLEMTCKQALGHKNLSVLNSINFLHVHTTSLGIYIWRSVFTQM